MLSIALIKSIRSGLNCASTSSMPSIQSVHQKISFFLFKLWALLSRSMQNSNTLTTPVHPIIWIQYTALFKTSPANLWRRWHRLDAFSAEQECCLARCNPLVTSSHWSVLQYTVKSQSALSWQWGLAGTWGFGDSGSWKWLSGMIFGTPNPKHLQWGDDARRRMARCELVAWSFSW